MKPLPLALLLAAGWLFAGPAASCLASKADDHAVAKDDAKKEKDPIEFTGYKRWDLAIYTVIVFLILFFILNKFAFPNIVQGLKQREDLLASAKDEAIKAKAEAEEMRKKLADEFALANDKIRALMEEARRDADALRVKEQEEGKKRADAERKQAQQEIAAAKDAALNEIYQKTVDLATLISTKAVRRSMNADDHRRLVDEALADLKNGRI
jgi:F-type H+-transporting ATPase subunit b